MWWDSSPLVFSSWEKSLVSRFPSDQKEVITRQIRHLYDPDNPAATRFTGVTTNPPLSYQAVQDDPARWSAWVQAFRREHPNAQPAEIAWALYQETVRLGAAAFLPVYQHSDFQYGHLSAQVNPYTFFDSDAMLRQAQELRQLAPNIVIKIPGTTEGVGVIRQLTALGIPTNCTSGYTVPQFIAVAEAVQAGLLEARARGVDLTGWRSVITYMSARWEGEPLFVEQARDLGILLSEEDLRWASVAIFKQAYRIFRQRAYPSKMLICSLRLGPRVNGEMRCWHLEETAGGAVIFTLPPPFLSELFTGVSSLDLKPRIREEIPTAVFNRLMKIPYFRSAYEPEGMSLDAFDQIPALLSTKKQFTGAMDQMVAFVEGAA